MRTKISKDVSRSPSHPSRYELAFTLVEMLVVIAVITILAGMLFGVVRGISNAKLKARARAELGLLDMAIGAYKARLGFYPPDNPGFWDKNQLFYELMGTRLTNEPGGAYFCTLDGSTKFNTNDFLSAFGANVSGFLNCSRGAGDEAVSATTFFRNGLKPTQFVVITNGPADVRAVLGTIVDGPTPFQVRGRNGEINPFRYNSSNPTNNPNSYDLWVDILLNGKTNRISNWSSQPQIVN